MQKVTKKYIPFICFVLIYLFCLVEESFIFEGQFHNYLYVGGHVIVRSFLRVICIVFIFGLGFIGLRTYKFKWIRNVWLFWFLVVIIAGAIGKLSIIIFHQPLAPNIYSFLNTFYDSALTPFPYMFVWLICFLARREK